MVWLVVRWLVSGSSIVQSMMGNGGASHFQGVNEKRMNENVSSLLDFVWCVAPEEGLRSSLPPCQFPTRHGRSGESIDPLLLE